MSDETTPRPDLRERIAAALTEWTLTAAGGRPDAFLMPHAAAALRNNSVARADAVMAVVQPEINRLHMLFDEAHQSLPIQQRRLLAISRMVFDGIAEGHPFTRDEAADLAQRIVDEIGHSVTDEPALGPSLREEIERLRAEVRAAMSEQHAEEIERISTERGALPEEERRRVEAGDAPLLRIQLAATAKKVERLEAEIKQLRGDKREWVKAADAYLQRAERAEAAIDQPAIAKESR